MSAPIDDDKVFAILTDTTRCTGCESCVHACKQTYGLGRDRAWRWKERIDDLSATRFTTIENRPGGHHVRKQCRHCLEPACVSACLVGALQKTELGPVVYDQNRCMGCRYCMMACPYGIPRYEWQTAVPYVRKCILCYDRIKEGKQPACTEACPYNATIFGTRAEMLTEARRRFAENRIATTRAARRRSTASMKSAERASCTSPTSRSISSGGSRSWEISPCRR